MEDLRVAEYRDAYLETFAKLERCKIERDSLAAVARQPYPDVVIAALERATKGLVRFCPDCGGFPSNSDPLLGPTCGTCHGRFELRRED